LEARLLAHKLESEETKTMTNVAFLASILIGLGFVATGNANAQSSSVVREFATRPSISVKAIVTTPEKAVGQVILLPGGGGDIGLNASGQITAPQMADNFTVRTRSMFVAAGYTTIVLDVASDVTNLISPTSRDSIANNRDDVVAVAATLKKESKLPLWVVGTSASSWRLVLMTHKLQSEAGISGIVLTGTVVGKSEMYWKAVEQITVPVLVVHHRKDACFYSKPEAIQPLVDALKAPVKKVVWIEDGNSQGDPCHEWAYHGFNGKEADAVGSILSWMKSGQ
jgi:hypothetical protein